jgi:hypothetical protein
VAVFAEEVGRVDEHAGRAAGGVVDGVAGVGFEDTHQSVVDLGRGEELARLGPGVIGELLDQVLVGSAEHVGRHTAV